MTTPKKVAKKVAKKVVKKVDIPKRQKKTLNMTKFVPSQSIGDYSILIYGERKIGKTTLAGQFEKAYHFMFESNDSYELYKSDILSWEDFKDTASQFLEGGHDFKTAVIDNGKNAYDLAMEYAGKKYGFEHPGGQNDFGASWSRVQKTFVADLRTLLNSQYGLIVLTHETEKELETRSGKKFTKVCPDLPKQADGFFTGEMYNIFYYHYVGTEKFLQIQGDEYITAGHRMKGHFLTPSGEAVWKIPMGNSEEEAYENLMRAFNNEQEETYEPERKGISSTLKRKVPKRKG